MSVYFYCTTWVIAKKSEDLDAITNEQLLEFAIAKGNLRPSSEIESWINEERKSRSGQVEYKDAYSLKITAGGSRGYYFNPVTFSKLHPNLLFVTVSGADCTDEEELALIKNGEKISSCIGVLNKDPFLAFICGLKIHPYYLASDDLWLKIENDFFEMVMKASGEDVKDAFRQDNHEDLEE